MADIKNFRYAAVRQKVLDAVRMDLIGPTTADEMLNERPDQSYITGFLYPADSAVTEDENYFDVEFTEKTFDADGESMEASIFEEDEPEEKVKAGFQKPASIGVSFYVKSDVTKLNACVNWGQYYSDTVQGGEIVDETIEEDNENKRKKKRTLYIREQKQEVVELDLNNIGRAKTIPFDSNPNIYIYVMQMQLDTGYSIISVYVHNNDKASGEEKEYEKIMFQVEILISDDEMRPVFVPEYICRNNELSDEYYYKGRPVYARGRGCAATWLNRIEEQNAYVINSAFIPDYEIAGVSANVTDMPKHAFSMLQMGMPQKKEETVKVLRMLTSMYQNWIELELKDNQMMKEGSFVSTGNDIVEKCENANKRMNAGIDMIEKNDKAYQAFLFMNQSMYMQRSITAFSKDSARDIPCSLSDYMKDIPEKEFKKDHSEWRPFQIAFIMLNICGIMNGESPEREVVDLLYFPTGGGKTEAYLGLIAFTIAYRRLTADNESDYEKDGGVTVFLRYTLRLLTTQQRDRLLKLIIAMEILREKSENKGDCLYGKEKISIGFWVGGNVTPNKFDDYAGDDIRKKNDFVRKITKQVIRCPYCGKKILKENYVISPEEKSVKIFCGNDNCYFTQSKGRNIPVYLVDGEIYSKCPTVVISTVDKFARLPWSEDTGLLFGRTNRVCERCGHVAIGNTKHPGRHNKTATLPAASVHSCKPFYPPELIIQDELHLITGPLGTIYGGYEAVVEEMCCISKGDKKIHPKYIVSTATIKNAKEQIKFLYARKGYSQFPPSGFDIRDSFFVKEVPLPEKDAGIACEEEMKQMAEKGQNPFRQYVGICASGQSVKTTLIRLYSIVLQTILNLSLDPEFEDYVDPYYTLIGYFNSIRELGGAKRLLDDDIRHRLLVLKKKYQFSKQRYIDASRYEEITSRMPSTKIAETLEKLAEPYDKNKERQSCYDVVIATNMIAVGMDVDRLGLMTVVGQPKQNSEYIQATSRVGRMYPGIIFTVYNPYRPRDLSNYENFVGFHSQMYRYVEGTTATPFAARARDRDLHALVVALLRLQIEELADNGGAGRINDITNYSVQSIKEMILERVKNVSPSSYVDTETEIDAFLTTWKDIAAKENLFYFVPSVDENKKRLLTYFDEYAGDKEKATLSSMRDVEQSSTVFYWEGLK